MSINPTYTKLFSPYTFPAGDLTVRNRLVLAYATSGSLNGNNEAVDDAAFFDSSSHGAGMAITKACRVIDHERAFPSQWSCAHNSTIPDLSRVADAIHQGSALAVLQLHHGSRGDDLLQEMTEQEIEESITAFGQGARRAIEAGFDAIEINGAGDGLLQQFFSPKTNRRSDQWGGSVESRTALPIAIVEEVQNIVRRYAYRPFAIGYRLSPEETGTPGITIEETMQLIEGLVACRPDWVHVATTDYFAGSLRNSKDHRRPASIVVEKVAGRTAVIGTGSIDTPSQIAHALDDGISLVAPGYLLVADPQWMEKIRSDNEPHISFGTAIME